MRFEIMISILNYENGLFDSYLLILMNWNCDLSYEILLDLRKWNIELLNFQIIEIDGFENVDSFYLNIWIVLGIWTGFSTGLIFGFYQKAVVMLPKFL